MSRRNRSIIQPSRIRSGRLKQCARCKLKKPIEDFGRRSPSDPRPQPYCPTCRREFHREYRQRNPDKIKARRDASRDKRRVYDRNRSRQKTLKSYGLTVEQYDKLVEQQEGKCAICGRVPDRLVVDHSHETGVVRGLLCRTCNAALGIFNDDPAVVIAAARYLESRREGAPPEGGAPTARSGTTE